MSHLVRLNGEIKTVQRAHCALVHKARDANIGRFIFVLFFSAGAKLRLREVWGAQLPSSTNQLLGDHWPTSQDYWCQVSEGGAYPASWCVQAGQAVVLHLWRRDGLGVGVTLSKSFCKNLGIIPPHFLVIRRSYCPVDNVQKQKFGLKFLHACISLQLTRLTLFTWNRVNIQ